MKKLEKQCLNRLNNLLSKFNLKIDIVNIQSNLECQYWLVDNSLSKTEWIGPWLTISDILVYSQSIFDCLKQYHNTVNSSIFPYIQVSDSQLSKLQRYSKVYQFIQSLKSNCIEELAIKMDLMGV